MLQGVVMSASSLIHGLVHNFAEDYKGCIQLAVSRLSRVIEDCIYISVLFTHLPLPQNM